MPRPVGYGRPGSKVFPDGWADAAAGVLNRTFDSTVQIGPRGGSRAWSDVDRQTVTAAADAVYDGPASIRPATDADGQPIVGQEQVTVTRYEITLPAPTAGVEVGHVVTVAASPDAELAGRTLNVVRVEYGDRRFTRLLHATIND